MNSLPPQEILEILIVDDDAIIRLLHQRVLRHLDGDFSVSSFSGGLKTLQHLEENKQTNRSFLVLLDINMPGMNGWQFLEECKNRRIKNLFVFILTSSVNPQDRNCPLNFQQVLGFFEKPFTKDKVLELMEVKELKHFFTLESNPTSPTG